MKAIKLPISFSSGGMDTLSSQIKIVEQQIIDVLVTSNFERVMNPTYGAGAYNLLYDIMDPLIFADFRVEALSELKRYVSGAQIIDMFVGQDDGLFTEEYNTTARVSVQYRIPPLQASTLTFSISEFLTAESV